MLFLWGTAKSASPKPPSGLRSKCSNGSRTEKTVSSAKQRPVPVQPKEYGKFNSNRQIRYRKWVSIINHVKKAFPLFIVLLFMGGLALRSWLLFFCSRRASVTYEFQWPLMGWGIALLTEILFGFILCLWMIPKGQRLHQFSMIYLILFFVLVALSGAFYWGFLYPIFSPEGTTTALINSVAGVCLFKSLYRVSAPPQNVKM